MRNAPSVTYPVGRSLWEGSLLLGPWTLGAAACGWWASTGAGALRAAAALAVVALCGAWAWAAWLRHPEGRLEWDGQGWTWTACGGTALPLQDLGPALDLQGVMLLRCVGAAVPGWLWVERRRSPLDWPALRRAVYSRAASPAAAGAEPPSAAP